MEERWWMVGCDGSVPHFYRARTGRSAVAAFRANLVEMERSAGVSIKDARIIVSGLDPQVLEGPLTPQQAFELDLGWLWTLAVCDSPGALTVLPSGPCTRGAAVAHLGEDKVARMESSALLLYRLGPEAGERDPRTQGGPAAGEDEAMNDEALEKKLMEQARPVRPESLREAREQVEELLATGLAQGSLSPAEARVEATRTLAHFETRARQQGWEDGLQQASTVGGRPEACRTTRHCAVHGWCHRCDPPFARLMGRVNTGIRNAGPEETHWGPLYAAIGRELRKSGE